MTKNDTLDDGSNSLYYFFTCGITSGTKYPLDDSNVNAILASIGVNLIIGASTIISNFLVILAIYQTPTLKTPSNYLLMNAAISDFLYGLICIPLFSGNFLRIYIQKSHDCNLFIIMMASIHFFGILSFWIILAVAVDRYIAVFKPYYYHEHISCEGVQKYRYGIVTLWAADAIFVTVALALKTFNAILIFEAACFVLIGGYSFFIHIKIYNQVRSVSCDIQTQQTPNMERHFKEHNINSEQVDSADRKKSLEKSTSISKVDLTNGHLSSPNRQQDKTQPNTSKITNKPTSRTKPSQRRLTRQERRVALLTFLMLASMFIGYIPYAVVTAAWLSGIDTDWTTVLNMWGFTFIALKTLSNPIIFCFSLKSIRNAVGKILTRGRIRNKHEITSTSASNRDNVC
ncbi:melanopsin-like [Clytia hemisphaerica]